MKKKILNALLMGVLVMTSMSVFVSCKDYDDDIDDLRVEQADLLSQLTSLQSDVQSQTSSITSQITSLQSSVSSLNTELQTAISDAASAAQSAGAAATAAATAQSTADEAADAAEAAQATADEALAKAQEALTKASSTAAGEALTKAESALTQITELSNKLGSLETLTDGIAGLVEQVNNAATKEELKTLSNSVDKYQSYFDNLFAMVTSVELYGSFSGSSATLANTGLSLDLMHGTVGENSTFGDDEAYDKSSPLVTYTKGTDIKQSSTGILVRVNPVNATLSTTSANCKILLINSKGESLDDYIEIASVKKYDELITRATSINSGLWEVALQFKDGVDMTAFEKATKKDNKNVVFAVAVNNTDTTKADRYVASTYDLALNQKPYEEKDELHYGVTNNHEVTYGTETGIGSKTIQNRYGSVSGVTEYTWSGDPATKKVTSGSNINVATDGSDNRSGGSLLPVEVNGDITIALDNDKDAIDYYYVTLDKDYATESAPSEWNAWTSYTYQGLFTTTKASDKLTLKVTSSSANGDIIGFRVYAVNYDGTLVDPDGKAFYVQVGSVAGEQDVTASITAGLNSNSVIVALPGSFNTYTTSGSFSGNLTIDADKSDHTTGAASAITYKLLKSNNASDPASDWKDAKYVQISIDPDELEDGGTFVASYVAKTGDQVINTLNVTVNKVMPTTTPDLTFKTGQVVNGVYNCYLVPTSWTTAATSTTKGSMDLTNVVNGLDNANFTWTFADAVKNGDKVEDYEVVATVSGSTVTYPVTVGKDFIDNETQHATTVEYLYKNISYKQKNGSWVKEAYPVEWPTTVNTIFSCPLDESVMSFSWNQGNIGTTEKANMVDVNYIIYGETTPASDIKILGATSNGIELGDYLLAKNTYDNTVYGGVWSTKTIYNKFVTGTIKATLTSDENGKEDYYTVAVGADGKFTFTVASNSSNPVPEQIKSTLTITADDAFGHTMKWTLPFYVKRR